METATIVNDETPRFKADAESKVKCKIHPKPKASLGDEVSKIDLSWEPDIMLTTNIEITNETVGVEMQSGGGKFKPVDVKPIERGGKWNYIIERVPCEDQKIRFFAKSHAGIVYSPFTKEINASKKEDIIDSNYELSPPRNVTGRMTKDKIIVSWMKTKCAEDYYVKFSCVHSELDDSVTVEVVNTNYELHLTPEQKKCKEWEVEITAYLGGKDSKQPARIVVKESNDDSQSMATTVTKCWSYKSYLL